MNVHKRSWAISAQPRLKARIFGEAYRTRATEHPG